MSKKCPKCGSEKTKIAAVATHQKRGLLWKLFIGIWEWMFKWAIGAAVACWDIIAFIIAKIQHKGYTWKCKQWFYPTDKKYYNCDNCGHSFRG